MFYPPFLNTAKKIACMYITFNPMCIYTQLHNTTNATHCMAYNYLSVKYNVILIIYNIHNLPNLTKQRDEN